MKNFFIQNILSGQKIDDLLCAVQTIKKSTTRDGKAYWDMVLFDKSGSIKAKVWESAISSCDNVVEGDVAIVAVSASEYQGSLQLVVSSMRKTNEYDESDFVAQSEAGVELEFDRLLKTIEDLRDPYLKNLLRKIIIEDELFAIELKNAFGAEKAHHAFLGGLVEHINEMVDFARPIIKAYPIIQGELLLTGIILHDIGKVLELSRSTVSVTRTRRGHLLGHIIQGLEMVERFIQEIDDFPTELADRLLHLIAAHHGRLEFGSPVKPMIVEAVALHYIDMLSSKLNMVKVLSKNSHSKDGFSDYSHLLESRFYFTPEVILTQDETTSMKNLDDRDGDVKNLTIPF